MKLVKCVGKVVKIPENRREFEQPFQNNPQNAVNHFDLTLNDVKCLLSAFDSHNLFTVLKEPNINYMMYNIQKATISK